MTLPVPHTPLPDAEIADLALRWQRASGGVMQILGRFGGAVEGKLQALPPSVQGRLLALTEGALTRSYGLARQGGRLGTLGPFGHRALAGVTGAVGGLGGLASATVEIPVTITLILRTIQEVAESHGFDPADEDVRREVLRVFASGTPMPEDDGVNTAFIGARLTLTGPAIQRVVAAIAPRIAALMGQKLATQAVPVLGAVAGASLNLAFAGYYRELAEIRFGLLRLARDHDPEAVTAAFAKATVKRPVFKV